jgi:SAM-dependent methyltransferase
MDPVSERVRAQYEQFPYPHHPVDERAPFVMAASYELAQYARTRRLAPHGGKRALIAGCGTGFELHATAAINPDFGEVIGVDFSEASLAVARERLQHHGIGNARAQWANLMDGSTLPDGPFDYIGSHGVLHHLADPAVGLRVLADRLAPGGVMAVMLYNGAGRWPLYQVRKALAAMGLDAMPQAEALPILKAMIKAAQPGTLLHMVTRGTVNDDYYAHDANLVDNLLHPQDLPFMIRDVPPWLAAAGLEFLEMADEARWRLGAIVDARCAPFYQRLRGLSGLEQLVVVEGLNPLANTEMIFWACKAGAVEATWAFDESFFASSQWALSPPFARYATIASNGAGRIVDWPLFYPNGQAFWPGDWQQRMLDRLRQAPLSGAEILAAVAAPLKSDVLKWFQLWENDRVVLRV